MKKLCQRNIRYTAKVPSVSFLGLRRIAAVAPKANRQGQPVQLTGARHGENILDRGILEIRLLDGQLAFGHGLRLKRVYHLLPFASPAGRIISAR